MSGPTGTSGGGGTGGGGETGGGGGAAGAGIMAGAALLGGLMQQRANRKAQKRQLEFQKFQNIAQIEQNRGTLQQNALNNIMASLRSAFGGR